VAKYLPNYVLQGVAWAGLSKGLAQPISGGLGGLMKVQTMQPVSQ